MTWEWREGLRGALFPLFFAAIYKALHLSSTDHVQCLVSPRSPPRIFWLRAGGQGPRGWGVGDSPLAIGKGLQRDQSFGPLLARVLRGLSRGQGLSRWATPEPAGLGGLVRRGLVQSG